MIASAVRLRLPDILPVEVEPDEGLGLAGGDTDSGPDSGQPGGEVGERVRGAEVGVTEDLLVFPLTANNLKVLRVPSARTTFLL